MNRNSYVRRKEYFAKRRAKFRSEGKCIICGGELASQVFCFKHLISGREAGNRYYWRHKDKNESSKCL